MKKGIIPNMWTVEYVVMNRIGPSLRDVHTVCAKSKEEAESMLREWWGESTLDIVCTSPAEYIGRTMEVLP